MKNQKNFILLIFITSLFLCLSGCSGLTPCTLENTVCKSCKLHLYGGNEWGAPNKFIGNYSYDGAPAHRGEYYLTITGPESGKLTLSRKELQNIFTGKWMSGHHSYDYEVVLKDERIVRVFNYEETFVR